MNAIKNLLSQLGVKNTMALTIVAALAAAVTSFVGDGNQVSPDGSFSLVIPIGDEEIHLNGDRSVDDMLQVCAVVRETSLCHVFDLSEDEPEPEEAEEGAEEAQGEPSDQPSEPEVEGDVEAGEGTGEEAVGEVPDP
jgi:hypothetical protein